MERTGGKEEGQRGGRDREEGGTERRREGQREGGGTEGRREGQREGRREGQ